jgi:hypothetical protein
MIWTTLFVPLFQAMVLCGTYHAYRTSAVYTEAHYKPLKYRKWRARTVKRYKQVLKR